MKVIDLRSDTVTHPTPEMREAMARADVGDDQSGEDPTVNRLEQAAARAVGKEAAMYVPSGVMGNLCAMLTHCGRGDEVVMGDESHIFWYESGGGSVLGGLPYRTVPNGPNGELDPDDVNYAIRIDRNGFPPTGLVCLENTHNRCGGTVVALEQMRAVVEVAHARDVPVHLDGARIFNAAAALGVPASEIGSTVDSVQFCLSKGLSAPVGSVLAGSAEFIKEARRNRKLLGGAMRQAGVIAAAGLVALEQMADRLPEDHAAARRFAEALSQVEGVRLDLATVQTNIVIFELTHPTLTPDDFLRALADEGLRVSGMGGRQVRVVAHHGIEPEEYDRAVEIVRSVLSLAPAAAGR
ncbi:MAG: GntG family PLP-dependent aldolase [Chloroflexia bacterium]